MTISLIPVLQVVAVGLLYGVFDLLRKRLTGALRPAPMLVWLALAQVPLFAWMLWRNEAVVIEDAYWGPGLISIALNIVANIAFIKALEIAALGVTIPLLSLTPVFATILSIRVLGELPSIGQMVGILLAVVGAFALNFDPGEGATPRAVWRCLVREKGSLLMIGVALCWSITPAFDKLAVASSGVYTHGLLLNAGVGVGALAWLVLSGGVRTLKPSQSIAVPIVLSAVVGFVALILLLDAYTELWVGLVETVRRAVNSVVALAFGAWLFGERIRAMQVLAIVLMSAGVALIFL